MSKRETPPSPYSEATVVQTRNPAPTPASSPKAHEPEGSERTVVQGRSNLKETFDARTVVRTSSSFPPEMPTPPKAPSPRIPEPPIRLEVAQPEPVKEAAAPAVFEQTGGAVQITAPTPAVTASEEKPVKKKKEKVPREPRKPLDQRSKLLIASFAVVAVLALIFVFGGSENSEQPTQQAQADAQANSPDKGQENLASEQPAQGEAGKFQPLSGPPAATTADVLNRFDRASARAQERAEQYSRTGGGF